MSGDEVSVYHSRLIFYIFCWQFLYLSVARFLLPLVSSLLLYSHSFIQTFLRMEFDHAAQ